MQFLKTAKRNRQILINLVVLEWFWMGFCAKVQITYQNYWVRHVSLTRFREHSGLNGWGVRTLAMGGGGGGWDHFFNPSIDYYFLAP